MHEIMKMLSKMDFTGGYVFDSKLVFKTCTSLVKISTIMLNIPVFLFSIISSCLFYL